jgi:RNase P protein component
MHSWNHHFARRAPDTLTALARNRDHDGFRRGFRVGLVVRAAFARNQDARRSGTSARTLGP